jgi:PKD repeat protein
MGRLFISMGLIRLPANFTISFYIKLAPGVDNLDTDITRKGSSATADPLSWWKVEIKTNKMQGVVTLNGAAEIAEKDTVERRDGLWHFVAYTRGGNTCSLIVDGSTVASRTNCATNAVNTAQLAIGAKDTEISGTGMDYTNGIIDEVRFFNRKLSATDLTSIKNNEHFTTGTVTRNITSIILPGEELKELGCNGTWDRSITKVDIMASTNNITWVTIQPNATKNVLYNVSQNNNYKYTRCSLSTTNASQTPIIESIRARISLSPSTIPPQPWNLQYTIGNYWVNHTWQAGTGVVTNAYNISVNGVWHNGTKPYYNDSAGASNWSDITVWAWNKSGSGNMSAFSASQNIQAPSLPLRINITSYAPLSPINNEEGANRTFSITVNETVDMTWFINGTQVSSNSSVTVGNYTNTSAKSGTWNVSAVANNSNGSVVKTWIWIVSDIIVNPGGPYTGTPGVVINFTGSASGGIAPYLYNWNFGDGVTSSFANPAHAYSTTGSYTANLTVTDSVGRTSSPDTAAVSVEWVRFINGTIMDSINNTGLAGVKVFTNTSISTVTNATGFYSFSVNAGTYNITATFEPVYYPNSTTISLQGAVVTQDIELLKKPTGNITGFVNS